MGDEINNFIKVWITAITCLCYCYYIVSNIPRGFIRLLFLLPVICLFIILPFNLSSVHLGSTTAFFLIWLGTFKLFLFSFGRGPLSSNPPEPLPHFISLACLPIKLKPKPSPNSPPNTSFNGIQSPKPPLNSIDDKYSSPKSQYNSAKSIIFAMKVFFFCFFYWVYQYEHKKSLHPNVVLIIYCCHFYLGLELVLAIFAVPARAILGLEIEPQFNAPYLATSLQDFWGYRWNLVVTSILRPTVYYPVRRIFMRLLGGRSRWASLPAFLATFAVSGLMHELLYYHIARESPTWEVTWFFVLHGVCMSVEVMVKKELVGKWQLHRAVSGALTLGFVAVTAKWLFFPQILRYGVDEKAISEYSFLWGTI